MCGILHGEIFFAFLFNQTPSQKQDDPATATTHKEQKFIQNISPPTISGIREQYASIDSMLYISLEQQLLIGNEVDRWYIFQETRLLEQ